MLLIRGRLERLTHSWSRQTALTITLCGPLVVLAGMAAGYVAQGQPWAFLLPAGGVAVGIAAAELGGVAVLNNSRRWSDTVPGGDAGLGESEHTDE
jgi:hypothetical protein